MQFAVTGVNLRLRLAVFVQRGQDHKSVGAFGIFFAEQLAGLRMICMTFDWRTLAIGCLWWLCRRPLQLAQLFGGQYVGRRLLFG